MSDPNVLNGVMSWQDSYIQRSHITPLVRKYANDRQRSKINARNNHGASSTSTSASSSVTSLSNSFSSSLSLISSSSGPVHDPHGVRILNLQRSVFTDDVDASMQEFQQLLKQFVASLQCIDATGSNITGRVFYNGRNFVVDDPDKEHVSVEAVQASIPTNQQNTNDTNSTASSTSAASQPTSGIKSIVRDDHPPLIIRIRSTGGRSSSGGDSFESRASSSSSDEDAEDEEEDEEEEQEEAHEGEGGRGRAFSDGVEGACREGETNAEDSSDSDSHNSSDVETPTASAPGQRSRSSHKKKKGKKKRKRREALPEIVDLTETPLLQLLQAQIQHASNSPHRHRHSHTAASASTDRYDYYYYVRTLYQENEKNFLRYYVQLNWLPYLQSIIMSSTPISGYGVVSLVASSCSNLQLLHLSDCPNLDNTGIYSIVNLCISLRRLDISRCRMVNRFGLMYVSEFESQAVRSLEYIDISHCGGNDTEEERRIAALEARQNPSSSFPAQQQQQTPHARKNSLSASRTSLASPFSAELVSLAVFNALEERGFHGRFIWQHVPKREELFGTPQYVPADTMETNSTTAGPPMSFPPSLFGNMNTDASTATSPKSTLLPNAFAPPTVAAPRQELQLLSPFHQAYSLAPDRIMDLATRDITAQVLCEVPWSYIKQQDRIRMERLKLHQVTLGTAAPNDLPVHLLPVPLKSGTEMGGFVEPIEAEMERQSIAASLLASASGSKSSNVIEPPKFYSLDLSGHLINDKLLGYILHNWGKSLYALILNGTYITASGLSELHQCANLHILSITHCSNITDKARANEVLKQSLKSIPFLMELNLTNSRLSGRMMSTHPNLKLQTLIANGCPISAFAIRMLSSAASASVATPAANGEAATPSAPPQNMCKYSLRFLSLANCAFVNRKALDYILKFSYLHLIDLSDCKGITRDDIMDTFYVLIDNEVKSLETKLKRKKSPSVPSKDSYSLKTISNIGCLLCHLHYIICFGIGGNVFSEKRALEFQKELNSSADKLQKLMLNIYYQQQAALDSVAQQAQEKQQQMAAAAASNLAAPPPFSFPQVGIGAAAAAVRGTPPPLPAFLSRDFLRDPIIVVSNRSSNILARYHPTLTRFAPAAAQAGPSTSAAGLASSRNQSIPMGVPIPSGLILGAAAAQLQSNADIAPPTMFRSNSLLDECPYTVLPPPITPPTPPVNTTSTASTASATSTAAQAVNNRQPQFGSTTGSTLFNTMQVPNTHSHRPSLGGSGPVSTASSLPSYMTLGHENASGGMAFPSSTGASTSPHLHHPHPQHVSTHPHLHVAPSASPSSAVTGGELYVAMPSMHFNTTAATPASAPPHHSSLEGLHRPSSTSFASTMHSPAMSHFPLATPSPAASAGATPYDAPNAVMFNSPLSAPTLSAPTSIHSATARSSTMESHTGASGVGGGSSLAAPFETVARASSASVGSLPQTGIPVPSFWSTLGPVPAPAPAPVAQAPATPVTATTASTPQGSSIPSTPQSVNSTQAYVSPFAALTHSHPTSNVSSTASTPLRPSLQPSLFNTTANPSPSAFPAFPTAFPSPFSSQFTSNANTPLQPGMSLSSIGLPVAPVAPTQQLHHQVGSSGNNNPGGVPSSSPSPSPSPSPPLQPAAAIAAGVPTPQQEPLFASLPQSAASSTAFEQALANAAAASRAPDSNGEKSHSPPPSGEGSQS